MIGALVGGLLGGIGSIFGGMGRNKMLEEQEKELRRKKRENDTWYSRRYNEDATQRSDAQRMLTLTSERIKERNRDVAGKAALMGGNTDMVAAERAGNAKALSDATSQIAVAGEDRKDAVESKYLSRNDELDNELMETRARRLNGYDFVGNAVGGAASGMMSGSLLDDIYKSKNKNL